MRRIQKIMQTSLTILALGTAITAVQGTKVEAAELQKQLTVTDAVVRLSDIFTDTGASGEAIVMEAPAPGKKKALSSYDLVKLAKKHKLEWERPAYLKRIYVRREGVDFALADMSDAILQQARLQDLDGEVEIRVFGRSTGLKLPFGYTTDDVTLSEFQLSEQRNRFSAILHIPTGTTESLEQRISGTIEEVRLVPMFTHVIAPGDVITEDDLTWKKYPIRRILRSAVVSSTQLVGQTVKRALPAGKLIRENDIAMPVLVAKGSIVLMTYKSGKLLLTMQGRALENGGAGETIRLMNQKSKKTVFATVVGDDHVEVAAANLVKLASR